MGRRAAPTDLAAAVPGDDAHLAVAVAAARANIEPQPRAAVPAVPATIIACWNGSAQIVAREIANCLRCGMRNPANSRLYGSDFVGRRGGEGGAPLNESSLPRRRKGRHEEPTIRERTTYDEPAAALGVMVGRKSSFFGCSILDVVCCGATTVLLLQ